MKNYGALRVIAGITIIVGWLIIVFGVLACVGVFLAPDQTAGLSIISAIAVALSFLIFGLIFIASGELLQAIVDIAINSASLPRIEQSAARTVEFFERMSANANSR
jgi:hypothetical protein